MKRAFLIGLSVQGRKEQMCQIPPHSGPAAPNEPKNLAHLVSPFIGCRKEKGAGKN